MKKSIAFIGAFFMGALAFAQVSKTDTINKVGSRKVLGKDLKNLPPNTESDGTNGVTSESVHLKGERKIFQKVTIDSDDKVSGTVTQKGREKAMSTTEKQHYTIKMTNANKSNVVDSPPEKVISTTEKQHYTIKMSNANKSTAVDTTSEKGKALNPYLKLPGVK